MMTMVMVLLLLLMMQKMMMNFVQRVNARLVNEVHPCCSWRIRQRYIETHLSMLLPPSPPPLLRRSHHTRHFQH